MIVYRSGDLNLPTIENPLKTKRVSGLFRIIDNRRGARFIERPEFKSSH